MESVLNNLAGVFNAFAYYFKSAISFITSNPYLLGFSVIAILMTNKSVGLGKLVKVKG